MRMITKSVGYVGVNDRTTEKFEGLWPLPYGVSYNSYIVEGGAAKAMIDTVETSHMEETLRKIAGSLDYLVVNHVEPDHSGGIKALLSTYPDLRIVTNKTAIGMIKGFYGVDDSRFMEVTDGMELDLGGATLRFVFTPMVHWPETMMTYFKEEKVIFSGDAFGCFGALNGGVIDTEMDTDWYFDEMYRYYSNIVGKYGKFVQKAMEKTEGAEVEYICSTHGPVWHERRAEVVALYDRLSRYEGEKGVTIVYGSMYGNTARLVDVIARRLTERGVRTIRIHNASKSDLSHIISDAVRYKGLIVGSPTYSMRLFPPVEEFMAAMETREIKGKAFAVFGNFTWASAAIAKFKEFASRMQLDLIGTVDSRQAPDDDAVAQAIKMADLVADAL